MPQRNTENKEALTASSDTPLRHSQSVVLDAWLRTASIEISAQEICSDAAAAKLLPKGTLVLIPWLPNSTTVETVQAAAKLRDAGLVPVPHVAARRLNSTAQTKALFEALVKDAGVDSVLLVAGDLDPPAGPYESALSLMQSGLAESAGIRRIGITGYPEGHPLITDPELQRHLRLKLEHLRSRSLSSFVATQFCFDAQAVLHWLASLPSLGVDVPVRIGVAGPTRLRKLLSMGLRCGIGNSLRALKGKAGALNALLSTHGPEELIAEMAKGEALAPSGVDVSLHLFAFGGAEITARWLVDAAARAG